MCVCVKNLEILAIVFTINNIFFKKKKKISFYNISYKNLRNFSFKTIVFNSDATKTHRN